MHSRNFLISSILQRVAAKLQAFKSDSIPIVQQAAAQINVVQLQVV